MAISPPFAGGDKKHPWWLTNRKMIDKHIKEAQALIATNDQAEIASALSHLDAALELSPRFEFALELKARTLLYLRRFKEVADMLQEYIPSLKIESDDSSLSSGSQQTPKERAKLLPSSDNSSKGDSTFKCFSVSDLKKKVMAGLSMNTEKEGHWRYSVLGQACYHLGLMEDAMVLLQAGKRLAAVSSRKESVYWSDDSFSFSSVTIDVETHNPILSTTLAEIEDVSLGQLLSHIKLLLGRRTAAIAAFDAGHYSEAIRHFSKILDSRRGTSQGFLAGCYVHRASAFKAAGRVAEAIADCNRALALDPTCIPALTVRAALLESIRCFQECLRDLEHLKLLYNTILRDRKLPGPAWRRHNVEYRDVPSNLHRLTSKIQEFKEALRSGAGGARNVDYYALVGLRRGCSRSELERAHLLLCLRHAPDKALNFIDRCEFMDYNDLDLVKDQARMSALLLYRLLQKAYSSVMGTIMDEEAAEKQRQKNAAALQAAARTATVQEHSFKVKKKESTTMEVKNPNPNPNPTMEVKNSNPNPTMEVKNSNPNPIMEVRNNNNNLSEPLNYNLGGNANLSEKSAPAGAFPGGFCRDIVIVANMLSKASFNHSIPAKYKAPSFNHSIPVKYEALSC